MPGYRRIFENPHLLVLEHDPIAARSHLGSILRRQRAAGRGRHQSDQRVPSADIRYVHDTPPCRATLSNESRALAGRLQLAAKRGDLRCDVGFAPRLGLARGAARRAQQLDQPVQKAVSPPVIFIVSPRQLRECPDPAGPARLRAAFSPSVRDKETVDISGLPFQLDPTGRARSGTGRFVGADASIRRNCSGSVPIMLVLTGDGCITATIDLTISTPGLERRARNSAWLAASCGCWRPA